MNHCRRYCQRATRTNPVGIQMLSESLHKQIFGDSNESADIPQSLLNTVHDHLKRHGLLGKKNNELPNVDFQLPAMQGIES